MLLLFTLESFRIHRQYRERLVQGLFMIGFLVYVALAFWPLGRLNPDLVEALRSTLLSGDTIDVSTLQWPAIGRGDLLYLLQVVLTMLMSALISLLIAWFFINDVSPQSPFFEKTSSLLKRFVWALPKLLFFALVTLLVMFISAFLFMLPLMIYGVFCYYVPLLMIRGRSITDAYREGMRLARTHIGMIIGVNLMTTLVLAFLTSIFSYFMAENSIGLMLIASFISLYQTVIRGRTMGLLYVSFNQQVVIEGKTILITGSPMDFIQKQMSKDYSAPYPIPPQSQEDSPDQDHH